MTKDTAQNSITKIFNTYTSASNMKNKLFKAVLNHTIMSINTNSNKMFAKCSHFLQTTNETVYMSFFILSIQKYLLIAGQKIKSALYFKKLRLH